MSQGRLALQSTVFLEGKPAEPIWQRKSLLRQATGGDATSVPIQAGTRPKYAVTVTTPGDDHFSRRGVEGRFAMHRHDKNGRLVKHFGRQVPLCGLVVADFQTNKILSGDLPPIWGVPISGVAFGQPRSCF